MTSLSARLALRFGLTAAGAGLAALAISLILFAGRMADAARDASAGFDGVLSGQMERAGDFMALELAARGRTALLDLDAGALTRIAQTATGGGLAGAVTFYDASGRAVADQGGPLPLDAPPPPRRLRAAAEQDAVHWRDDAAFRSGRAVCIAGRCVGWVVVTIDAAPALAERAAIESEIAGARSAFLADAALLGLGALAMTAGVAALTGRRLGARAQGGATAVLQAIERMTAAPRDVRARPRPEQIAEMTALAATLAEQAARGAPLDAVGEATLVADASGAIDYATPALHALLRVAPTTLEGADAHVVFGLGETASAETLAEAFDRLVETPTGDGERLPVLAAAAIAGDAAARKVVCVLRCADRLLRAEQAEAQRRFRIETADRARDAFLTAMRDEIGRPARPAAAAEGEPAAPAKKPGLGAKLAALAAPAGRAVDRLLRLARLRRTAEAPPADRVDPVALAAAVAEGVAGAAEFKRLALSVRVQQGAPVVLGDFEALRRIGAAFADNAVAATSRGEVVIDVAHRVIGEQAEIALTVQDSGPGLDADGLDAVTRLLTKPADGGSGLAVAARLAAALGAAIDVGGAPGDGASFTLTFRAPIDPTAPPATGGGMAPASTPGAGQALAPMAPLSFGGIGLPPLGPGVGPDDAAPTAADDDAADGAAPLVMIPMAAAPIMGGDAGSTAMPDAAPDAPPLTIPMATAALMVDGPPPAAGPGSTAADAAAGPSDREPEAATTLPGDDATGGQPDGLPPPEREPTDAEDSWTDAAAPEADDAGPAGPRRADDQSDADPAATAPSDMDPGGLTARPDPAPDATDAAAGPVAIIAEGNQVDRIVLTTFLRKAGYACEIAETPAEVLASLQRAPALVLLGGAVGGADGVRVVETLRAREKASATPPLVIYGVASAGDEALADALRAAGADDILTRPIRRDALALKLGARLERAAS
jgi:signal transduction histidine kinase/CheY-like chemotaxis protein